MLGNAITTVWLGTCTTLHWVDTQATLRIRVIDRGTWHQMAFMGDSARVPRLSHRGQDDQPHDIVGLGSIASSVSVSASSKPLDQTPRLYNTIES
jgi:hypothetical protein